MPVRPSGRHRARLGCGGLGIPQYPSSKGVLPPRLDRRMYGRAKAVRCGRRPLRAAGPCIAPAGAGCCVASSAPRRMGGVAGGATPSRTGAALTAAGAPLDMTHLDVPGALGTPNVSCGRGVWVSQSGEKISVYERRLRRFPWTTLRCSPLVVRWTKWPNELRPLSASWGGGCPHPPTQPRRGGTVAPPGLLVMSGGPLLQGLAPLAINRRPSGAKTRRPHAGAFCPCTTGPAGIQSVEISRAAPQAHRWKIRSAKSVNSSASSANT